MSLVGFMVNIIVAINRCAGGRTGLELDAMTSSIKANNKNNTNQHGGVLSISLIVVGVILLIFVGYLFLVLNWSYAEGERAGVLQKISRKGWICKTWEGELAMSTVPGVAPTIWQFSVRDSKVAEQLSQAAGRRVVLHYQEHRGIPTSCFGETNYFVVGVRIDTPPQ